ncbi:LysR family transcriptional regulator [Streptomyces sp. NPDC047028]|uniref:LysR family transcriptional regulator n=1 Tax=Streptomyces sp. NPDC047028 TaxID=3155793 RepID=UPI0033DF24B6
MPAAPTDPRLLRAFVTVAEELHFTRAAARLYVAQQALSRDVRRLERDLGTELFLRTTRQVTLTPDGERLLPHARKVLAAHDDLLAAFGQARPLLVDLNSPGPTTARRVLHRARELAPDHELMARYESGLTGAATEILAGRLDASFGRYAGLDPALRAGLDHHPVRYEQMAILLPEAHPLSSRGSIPLPSLSGETVYAGAGNPRTPEWTALAENLFSAHSIHLAPPLPLAVGDEEFERIMSKTGHPVLAVQNFPTLPGTVLRPLTSPIPLSPLSLVWRKGLTHPALTALHRAATELGDAEGWLRRPPGSWIPSADEEAMTSGPTLSL